jgi:ubiquinone/menaquinone biosynthesis C-methylase UbiE
MQFEPEILEFLEFEKRRWPIVASGYHRFFEPVTGRVAEPLLVAAGVGPGARVLDVATGPGYVARAAAAMGASVVGLDISPEVVALARSLNPDIEFVTGDAHQLPFAADSFDSVVANFLLPHLGDHLRSFSDLVRVLRPNGRMAASTWDLPERSPLVGLIQEAVAIAGASPPPGIPTAPSILQYSEDAGFTRLLEQSGLQDVAVTSLVFHHHLASPQALWDGVVEGTVRTSLVVSGQSPEVIRRIRKAFEELSARYKDGDGLVLPVSVKIGSGTKR